MFPSSVRGIITKAAVSRRTSSVGRLYAYEPTTTRNLLKLRQTSSLSASNKAVRPTANMEPKPFTGSKTTTKLREANSGDAKSTSPLKLFVGVSAGILFVAGSDIVAPLENPFHKSNLPEKTYWNEQLSRSTTTSSSSSSSSNDSSSTNHKRSLLLCSDQQPLQCQVLVVGGGMAGLHTALALSERQPKRKRSDNIVILDAGFIGQGSSGKSKGLVVPGIQVPQEVLEHQCGSKEIAQKIYNLTYAALNRLKIDIVKKYKINCDWVDAGHVEASLYEANDDGFDDDEEDNDKNDDGVQEELDDNKCRELTASEVKQMLGQPKSSTLYKCGEYDPSCSGVDPLALTRGLATVLHNKGVQIFEHTKAVRIDRLLFEKSTNDDNAATLGEYKYMVTTENGAKIQCQHVVLCTGPELVSRDLSRRLENSIIPIYTWMVSTAPMGDKCPLQGEPAKTARGGSTSNRKPAPLCGDDYVSLNYWRATDDGRLLFGSLADAYPTPQWLAERRLRRALLEVYPQLPKDISFDHVWGGWLAFPRGAVPLIGRDEGFDDDSTHANPTAGGVWYATGFGGHGIIPTVMAGSIVADGILGRDDETWRLFHREFPARYNFWPVSRLGAEAILILYNVFDWLHVKGVPVPRLPAPW